MVKKKLSKSERIRQMLLNGMTMNQIVKEVKCTKALVYQIRRKIDAKEEARGIWPLKTVEVKIPVTEIPPFLQRKDDIINHPPHYMRNGIEVVDVIEAFELNYRLGNVVKYVLRHVGKGGLNDLKKAQWYLNREISKHE